MASLHDWAASSEAFANAAAGVMERASVAASDAETMAENPRLNEARSMIDCILIGTPLFLVAPTMTRHNDRNGSDGGYA